MSVEEEFDGKSAATGLLKRVHNTRKYWAEVYKTIGKPFEYVYGLPEPKRGTIIGVVKDFNYASLHGTIEPLMMHIYPRYHAYMSIKIEGISVANTVENVKSS